MICGNPLPVSAAAMTSHPERRLICKSVNRKGIAITYIYRENNVDKSGNRLQRIARSAWEFSRRINDSHEILWTHFTRTPM